MQTIKITERVKMTDLCILSCIKEVDLHSKFKTAKVRVVTFYVAARENNILHNHFNENLIQLPLKWTWLFCFTKWFQRLSLGMKFLVSIKEIYLALLKDIESYKLWFFLFMLNKVAITFESDLWAKF